MGGEWVEGGWRVGRAWVDSGWRVRRGWVGSDHIRVMQADK